MNVTSLFSMGSQVSVTCPEWLKKCELILGTADLLPSVVDLCIRSGSFGLDTEGTGLDTRVFLGRTQSSLVGFSVAPTNDSAFYFPLGHRHSEHLNIPFSLFAREFQRLCQAMREKRTRALLYNAPYDQEILTYCGAEGINPWDDVGCWEDAHILVKLDDLNRKKTKLKTVAKEDWGWDVIEIEELFPEQDRALPDFKTDFSALDPASPEVLWYTCQDALLHRRIFEDYYDRVVANPRGPKERKHDDFQAGKKLQFDRQRPSQALIYQVEKACVLATRWMGRNRVGIDRDRARELIEVGQREWTETVKALYDSVEKVLGRSVAPNKYKYLFEHPYVDAQVKLVDILKSCEARAPKDHVAPVNKNDQEFPGLYDINSPQQLGKLLVEMEIPDLRITEASKQVGTSDDDIEEIVERHGDKFPSLKLVGRMREINKALSVWLLPLYNGTSEDGSGAFGWRQIGTETGRYSAPKPKRVMTGWPQTAFQTLPVDKGDRPECMRRIREVICGRSGRLIVSIDYSGVELRIVTALSAEPKWVAAFFCCSDCGHEFDRGDGNVTPEPPPPRCPECGSDKIGDIHTGTAIEVLGANPEDADWKEKRGRGKVLNFALLYGGGGDAASAAIDCDTNEGWRIKRKFNDTFLVLKQFWDLQHEFAHKNHLVVSAFGRVMPLPDIAEKDPKKKFVVAKAERNSVNGPIQATSADITKVAMALIYKEVVRRGWEDKVLLIATVHDELVFEMDPSVIEEAIDVLVPLMCRNPLVTKLNWSIPLTSDVEIGRNWSVPWNLIAMRAGEVRYLKDKKVKKPEEAAALGAVWDELPSFPSALLPYFKKRDLGYEIRKKEKEVARVVAPDWIALDAGSDLTEDLVDKVAKLVLRCRGTGPTMLRLRASGEWLGSWTREDILVDAAMFCKEAESVGLRWLSPN